MVEFPVGPNWVCRLQARPALKKYSRIKFESSVVPTNALVPVMFCNVSHRCTVVQKSHSKTQIPLKLSTIYLPAQILFYYKITFFNPVANDPATKAQQGSLAQTQRDYHTVCLFIDAQKKPS